MDVPKYLFAYATWCDTRESAPAGVVADASFGHRQTHQPASEFLPLRLFLF